MTTPLPKAVDRKDHITTKDDHYFIGKRPRCCLCGKRRKPYYVFEGDYLTPYCKPCFFDHGYTDEDKTGGFDPSKEILKVCQNPKCNAVYEYINSNVSSEKYCIDCVLKLARGELI